MVPLRLRKRREKERSTREPYSEGTERQELALSGGGNRRRRCSRTECGCSAGACRGVLLERPARLRGQHACSEHRLDFEPRHHRARAASRGHQGHSAPGQGDLSPSTRRRDRLAGQAVHQRQGHVYRGRYHRPWAGDPGRGRLAPEQLLWGRGASAHPEHRRPEHQRQQGSRWIHRRYHRTRAADGAVQPQQSVTASADSSS